VSGFDTLLLRPGLAVPGGSAALAALPVPPPPPALPASAADSAAGAPIRGGGAAGGAGAGGGGGWGTATEAGRVLDFRRRGAPPRRRRRSPLLALARPLGVAVLTVALPLGLASWVLTSRRFQLRGFTVTGTQRVPEAWVRQALAPLDGRNLVRLPLDEVRERLAANPWIAAVDATKQLPDHLRVTVAERLPAVLVRRGGGPLLYADAAGRPIAPAGSPAEQAAARRRGLLLVSLPLPPAAGAPLARPAALGDAADADAAAAGAARAGSGLVEAVAPASLPAGVVAAESLSAVAGALRLAARLRQLRPAWAAALQEIEALDDDDYRLQIEGLPCPLLVRGSRLAGNLDRFEQLLPELRRRYPALAGVDLRFARRIVVQPATAAAAARPALSPNSRPVPGGPAAAAAPPVPPAAGAPRAGAASAAPPPAAQPVLTGAGD
jgi:hypothetical protein